MTRIKYTTQSNHLYTEWFLVSPNVLIRGIIYLSDFRYMIQTQNTKTDTGTLPVSNSASSLRAAKSQVRKKLIELGLKLDDEIRIRNYHASKG